MSKWEPKGKPLTVDESQDNPEPTEEDEKHAQENYDHMPPSIRKYVDALNRKFDA